MQVRLITATTQQFAGKMSFADIEARSVERAKIASERALAEMTPQQVSIANARAAKAKKAKVPTQKKLLYRTDWGIPRVLKVIVKCKKVSKTNF